MLAFNSALTRKPFEPRVLQGTRKHELSCDTRRCSCRASRRECIQNFLSAIATLPFAFSTAATAQEGELQVQASPAQSPQVDAAREFIRNVLAPTVENEPSGPATRTVKQYMQIINASRPKSWQQIALRIQKNEYYQLSNDLVLSPFDDLRQACFLIPWALLNNQDNNAANDSRKAYDDFMDHVTDLDRISQAASNGEARPELVQQAFFLLSASLDKFIFTVPKKYYL